VKVGDSIPNLDILVEDSPGNKVNLAAELSGNGIIVGVPAAFSTCLSSKRKPSVGSRDGQK
jgi:2-Cys peroxiredoxin 5